MNVVIFIIFIILLIIYFIYNKKKYEAFTKISSYDDINFWRIDQEHYLFFDIFARNNELIIICPAYDYYELNYDKIDINMNNNKLKLKYKYDFIEHEPCVIRIYDLSNLNLLNNQQVDLVVKYNNEIREFNIIHKILKKQYNVVASTLFKNDDYLLDTWFNYYNNQNIEFYFMYVNKKIDKVYNYKNTKFIEWDFHYWNKNYNKYGKNLKHHAQLGQINHCIYKYCKPLSNWCLNIDLDELMYVENKKINQVLDDNYNIIRFENYFSYLDQYFIPQNKIIDIKKSKIYSTKKSDGIHSRTKYIAKSDDVICNGIHSTKKLSKQKLIKENFNNKLLHFQNWSYLNGKNRKVEGHYMEIRLL